MAGFGLHDFRLSSFLRRQESSQPLKSGFSKRQDLTPFLFSGESRPYSVYETMGARINAGLLKVAWIVAIVTIAGRKLFEKCEGVA